MDQFANDISVFLDKTQLFWKKWNAFSKNSEEFIKNDDGDVSVSPFCSGESSITRTPPEND